MASQPPPESPVPSSPVSPGAPPPEIAPVGPDFDQPSPGIPASDPGTSQPAQM